MTLTNQFTDRSIRMQFNLNPEAEYTLVGSDVAIEYDLPLNGRKVPVQLANGKETSGRLVDRDHVAFSFVNPADPSEFVTWDADIVIVHEREEARRFVPTAGHLGFFECFDYQIDPWQCVLRPNAEFDARDSYCSCSTAFATAGGC